MKQVIITKDRRILFLDVPQNFVVLGGKLYVGDGIPTEEAVAEWITVNGAHIPLNSQGEQIGGPKIGEKKEVAKTYKFRYNYTVSSNIQMREKGHYIPKGSKVTGVKPIAKGEKVKQLESEISQLKMKLAGEDEESETPQTTATAKPEKKSVVNTEKKTTTLTENPKVTEERLQKDFETIIANWKNGKNSKQKANQFCTGTLGLKIRNNDPYAMMEQHFKSLDKDKKSEMVNDMRNFKFTSDKE